MVTAVPEPLAEIHHRQLGLGRSWTSSSHTITPHNKNAYGDPLSQPTQLEYNTTTSLTKPLMGITQTHVHDNTSHPEPVTPKANTEMDPARRIWSEMRKNSRSATKRSLQMTSSRSGSSEVAPDDTPRAESEREMNLQKEQARILEQALKNKRSVGADTLRSMAAPSTQTGLSFGRAWGWAPPWW